MIDAATIEEFEVHLLEPAPLTKGEREMRAFRRLLPELLRTHSGQYVAIHNEEVVDCGSDDITLINRVRAAVGYVPIHVGLVTNSIRVERIAGPRALHSLE